MQHDSLHELLGKADVLSKARDANSAANSEAAIAGGVVAADVLGSCE